MPVRRKQKGASQSIPKACPVPPRTQSAPDGLPNSAPLTPTPNTTTTDGTTTYMSEGPTLPIIGGGAGTATGLLGVTNNVHEKEQRARKRRRTADGDGDGDGDGDSQDGIETTTNNPVSPQKQKQPQPSISNLLAPLYKPWTLLPTIPRAHLTARFGEDSSLEENIIPVVFTRNQNIRSGVNKIRAYLLKGKDKILAISAHGEATIKMVGILGMVKKVACKVGDGDSEVCEWYKYTVLSSLSIGQNEGPAQKDDDNEDDDAFEPVPIAKERDQEKKSERAVPVLSVWMSRTPIPQFRSAFGEERLQVVGAPAKEER